MQILVVAKAPVPGRVKTRLCPPLDHEGAAAVAAAALADTLDAAGACGASRRVVALDGDRAGVVPTNFDVVAQRGRGLAERLAAAWADSGEAGVQIGMDTPQVTAVLLDEAFTRLAALASQGDAAVLGPATDGGWWAIGLSRPAPEVFAGVPMSTSATGAAQLARLRSLGFAVELLPELRDIDLVDDLRAVAAEVPGSRTAIAAGRLVGV